MRTRILFLAGVAALGGCIHEDSASIELFAVCAFPDPDAGTGACTYANTCGKVLGGTFCADVSDPTLTEAIAAVQVNNLLPNNQDLSSGRVNTNDFTIQQWRLEFHLPGSSATLPEVWMDANVTVPANGSQVAFVPVLPPTIVTALAAAAGTGDVVVWVRAHGVFHDERILTTGPFKIPVAIRAGCGAARLTCTSGLEYACPQFGQTNSQVCKS